MEMLLEPSMIQAGFFSPTAQNCAFPLLFSLLSFYLFLYLSSLLLFHPFLLLLLLLLPRLPRVPPPPPFVCPTDPSSSSVVSLSSKKKPFIPHKQAIGFLFFFFFFFSSLPLLLLPPFASSFFFLERVSNSLFWLPCYPLPRRLLSTSRDQASTPGTRNTQHKQYHVFHGCRL